MRLKIMICIDYFSGWICFLLFELYYPPVQWQMLQSTCTVKVFLNASSEMQKLQYPKIIRESLLWKNAQTQETFFISCKQTFKTLNTVSTLQYNLNTGEIHFSTCITPIIFFNSNPFSIFLWKTSPGYSITALSIFSGVLCNFSPASDISLLSFVDRSSVWNSF